MNTIMQTVKEIEEAICHGDHTYTGSYGMQQYRTFMNAVGYAPGDDPLTEVYLPVKKF